MPGFEILRYQIGSDFYILTYGINDFFGKMNKLSLVNPLKSLDVILEGCYYFNDTSS